MHKKFTQLTITIILFFVTQQTYSQLIITAGSDAQQLAEKLVGNGISISNATLTGSPLATGFFNNVSGTKIGIDSGIVLTNGRAKTKRGSGIGMDGDGRTNAFPNNILFPENAFSGDADLATLIDVPPDQTHDATILEFDFVPLGDTVKFNYVFGSEEYPLYACSEYNDAFAFFISGPGFPSLTNIALIPQTTASVTIANINEEGCGLFPQFYINNETNVFFNYNGHTTVFNAVARVQPCQTYHLKLVIADVGDGRFDSGVFLESKSLTSSAFQLINIAQTDPGTGLSYLVEGCNPGSLKIQRQLALPYPQIINLAYGGTAINSVDVQTLPTFVTIPANQTEVLLNIVPIIDNIPEGIETLEIYTLAPCAVGIPIPTDTAHIQIRDYDILGIVPDSANICRRGSIQLAATTGYSTYKWDANATLTNTNIRNPVAMPVANKTTYYCTATLATCSARDSAYIRWKDIELLSQKDINCKNGNTGQIKIGAGAEWIYPLTFSIDNAAYQADSTFNGLTAGSHIVRVKEASGCIDSITVTLTQLFPDLGATSTSAPATCTGITDGNIVINPTGGKAPYQFSVDNGINFQPVNRFNLPKGNYQVIIKDNNGCTFTQPQAVRLNDELIVDAGNPVNICEGTHTTLTAISNGLNYTWSPVTGLTTANSISADASPVVTTKYFVTATKGICTRMDSVVVTVDAAPIANAGKDIDICFGASTILEGSGGATFAWSPVTYLSSSTKADSKVVKPAASIAYYLVVKDAKGCFSLHPDTVNVKVTPVVRVYAGRDTSIAINQPLRLNAVDLGNSGITSYTWSPPEGLNNPGIASPVAILQKDMLYTVTAKTAIDCIGTDQVFVKAYVGPEIYVPTAFTPNGDANNDLLIAKAIGMKIYRYFSIFDRWGKMVFSTVDFSKGWDGRIHGLMQNTGTYVWIAEAVDFKGNVVKRRGTTTLLR